jgi:hypothetical protein
MRKIKTALTTHLKEAGIGIRNLIRTLLELPERCTWVNQVYISHSGFELLFGFEYPPT